jgi:5-methylcytosine-specific restriction endonuclease McrA
VTIGIASWSPTPLVASAGINKPVGAVAPNKPAVTPLAPDCFKVQLTISRETHDKLRRVQDLLRHVIPTGHAAEIFDRALTVLLADLERRRYAETSRPRPAQKPTSSSRHIPAAVRREVWQRDAGRCAFIGSTGRCRETGFLEFHHVEPYAAGGPATVSNIQLRCRLCRCRHKRHYAEWRIMPRSRDRVSSGAGCTSFYAA